MIRYLQIFFLALCSLVAKAQNTNNLEFVENKGQWDKSVTFQADLGNGEFYLRKTGFMVVQHNPQDLDNISSISHGHMHDVGKHDAKGGNLDKIGKPGSSGTGGEYTLRSHAYFVELDGMDQGMAIEGNKPLLSYNSYFIGNDPSKWAGGCRIFNSVTYRNVYPKIDMRFFTDEGMAKYEFIVQPGGDPSDIVMRYEGADKLLLSKNELVIKTSVGDIRELPPYSYQSSVNGRTIVKSRYQLKENKVQFVIDNYDKNNVLIIDPTVIFCSFSGSKSDNWGYTATYGGDGSLYGGGIVFGPGFPVSPGAFQQTFGGSSGQSPFNMGIIKLNRTGSNRIYATYIGGNETDQPHSLIEDRQGNLIIAGRSASTNYPALRTYGPTGRNDIVLTKLNSTGTGLIGSLKIGGSGQDGYNTDNSHTDGPRGLLNFYGDDARSEVELDRAGNVYLGSCTQSNDFPTTANAPFKTLKGFQDAVLIKTDPNVSGLLMSTYFGGDSLDAAFVVEVNPLTNDIWVGGSTMSSNFPGDKTGTLGATYLGGHSDGFVAIFSNDGTVLKKSTFIGTAAKDALLGLKFDRDGAPYVMGVTYGAWPIKNAIYGTAGAKQYIGKLKADLSDWQYTTTFGTNSALPNISPVAFLVDRCQNVYVSGWGGTNLARYPMAGTVGMDISPDAYQKTTDDNDFYFIVIKRNASALLYATFFGQSGNLSEHVDGGTSRYDQNGIIYQGICSNCYVSVPGSAARPRFPITPGAWCCSNKFSGAYNTGNGAECNWAGLKIAFNFAGVGAGVKPFINGVHDSIGCVPLTVKFSDTIRNAQSYLWNFGDGTPELATTNFDVEHNYNSVGTYLVRLIAIDSTSCNIRDTSFTNIKARADKATIDFSATKIPPCTNLSFRFNNLSVSAPGKAFNDSSFIWDFGDGTRIPAGINPVVHDYLSVGSYNVRLILRDTLFCNEGDSVAKEFNIAPNVVARFELPDGCSPYTPEIKNTSIAGQTYFWDFGDGTTSTDKEPIKTFNSPGTYRVKLVVTDPFTCNVVDSAFRNVLVQAAPVAGFTNAPIPPLENTPTVFSNTSSADAVSFLWEFGDGDTLRTTSRTPIEYQYNATGQFNACLVAVNQSGCPDTLCLPVDAIVSPKVDLPNAFTPLGSAPNNQVFVRGFAIGRMKLMIFNRYGQKVYETTSQKVGWDGKFNGVVQPMDVYAYVLEVEFTDGTRTTKKGDITLIR